MNCYKDPKPEILKCLFQLAEIEKEVPDNDRVCELTASIRKNLQKQWSAELDSEELRKSVFMELKQLIHGNSIEIS